MDMVDRLHSNTSLAEGAAQLGQQKQPTTPIRKARRHLAQLYIHVYM